jgi:hypothetical protein
MAYTKVDWKARKPKPGVNLNRYAKSQETSLSVVLVNDVDPDDLLEPGTPLSAENMNIMDEGIADLDAAAAALEENKVDKNGTDRLMTAAEGTKLGGIQAGAQVNPGAATASAAGLMSGADKSKLDNIAAGATANSPSTSYPRVNGTASAGSEAGFSRGDHVHPVDTSRQAQFPINSFYTQYPNAASSNENTAFPASQRPNSLLGGNWKTCFEGDQVFFRTGGDESSVDSGRDSAGLQMDMLASHRHQKANGYANPNAQYNNSSFLAQVGDLNTQGASYTEYAGGAETRPKNRRMIVWQKTAL